MSSGFRISVMVTAEKAMMLYRELEMKSSEAARQQELIAAKKPENMVRLYFGAVRVAACVQ
jgi:hypothetical protein